VCRVAVAIVLAALLPAACADAVAADPASDAREAVDAMLACERPDGGWTYVCNPPSGPHGIVTRILVRARQIESWLGGPRWDVLVVRSPGTPTAGLVLLDASTRWRDPRYLAAARRAGDILLAAQLGSGGWASEVPVRGTGVPAWFRWLNQWTALDDDVTSGASRFLLALGQATGDAPYRDAARRALDLLVEAQRPDGAWPLTRRPAWYRWLSPSFEDWASTNDAATAGPIEALIEGAKVLGTPAYLASARRGGDWLVAAQRPAPQAGWAQQYDPAGRPAPGRRFEPVAIATWESREMIDALISLARATGDRRYCRAVAPAVRWLLASAIAPGCWARLHALDDNAPLFVDREGRRVASAAHAKRPYQWTGDYGVPGLLGTLGLGADGRRLAGAPPPRRIAGDPGACAGTPTPEDTPTTENPRRRIVRAAVLMQRLAPAPVPMCADEVRAN
jgi:hypothetical protein